MKGGEFLYIVRNIRGHLKILITLFILILLLNVPNIAKADTSSSDVQVNCTSHVQNIGWMNTVSDGQISGTVGKSLRLEALKISLSNATAGMYITYQVHVEEYGWMNSVQDGQVAGTTGKGLRVEAIKIQLHNAPGYHVQYQAQVQNIGWMDSVQDGQIAGTTGKALRMEAIKIKIVKDNNIQPNYKVVYQAQVEDIGWQDWNTDLSVSGTTNRGLRLEALRINVQNLQPGMNIKYQAQVENIGWMDWVRNGQIAGTVGKSLRIEAFKIELEGMPGYHVQYQAQVQNIGWMDWVEDGQISGTTGQGLRIEALRIRVVKDQTETLAPKNIITQPTNNSSFYNNQNINLTGYALNQYDNKEIDAYLDGALLGNLNAGLDSSSVNSTGYLNGSKSRYSVPLPISNLCEGNHTITVIAIGNNQSISKQSINVNVHALQPTMCIDTPTDGTFIQNQAGQLNIKGWSLDAFGVKNVQILLDNSVKGNANIGIPRADVDTVFPHYINGVNSGFNYNMDIASIPDGVHTITVKSTGNDGDVISQDLKIYKFSGSGQCSKYNLTLSQMVAKQMAYGEPVMAVNWNWVSADSSTVQKYVNPLNYMDNYGIYQFLRLDYIQGVTADDLNNILSGKGVLSGKGDQFLLAAQQSNINPIYLVSHALLETGNGQSALATGITVNGRVTYNLFGIHAFDSDPNSYGSQYAYSKNWFSVDAAIYGGASWISGQYINNSTYKQNTLYKMRWNPASPANHQYATDVSWAYNQIYNIKKLMDMVSNPALQFDIPQYN